MTRRIPLLLALGTALLCGAGHAESFFQVRGFLPTSDLLSSLTVDAGYSTALGDGLLDLKLTGVSLDRQSASLTYAGGTFFALAQLDRSRTTLGGQGLLLGVVQGTFDDPLLQTLGLTVTQASGDGAGFGYSTTSADLSAAGRFSDALSWTASSGGSLTDAGSSGSSSTQIADLRARAELKAQLSPDAQVGGGLGASRTGTTGEGFAPLESLRAFAFVNTALSLTEQEKFSASGQLDLAGSTQGTYALDATLDSSRLDPLKLSARSGLTPDGASYGVSASLPPNPFGGRLSLSGTSGSSSTGTLELEGQYQQGRLGAQLGGGLGFGGSGLPTTRLSAGVSTSGGDLSGQVRANASLGAVTTGGLSGRVSLKLEGLKLDLGATLTLGTAGLSGETDVQLFLPLSDGLEFNFSGRYRPNTANSVQAGFGLRIRL